ncbi:MAG: entericidin A/B family lipoprotein [Alphaproteobacteria bacterium]|nr:entericidin A/B family lipoprotein [Alphaproteobacteria bacterium]
MRRIAFAALLLAPVGLAGCYTVDGVGQDVSAAGRGISHVANEVREEVFEPDPSVPVAEAGEPCDPAAGELAGGSGLPACPQAEQ